MIIFRPLFLPQMSGCLIYSPNPHPRPRKVHSTRIFSLENFFLPCTDLQNKYPISCRILICPSCQFKTVWSQFYKSTLSDKNSSDKSVEISACCRKFCPTKHFVRRKFCPIFQYKSQVKIGQNCRNFGLVSKILSDEIFCPSKILSDEILSDKVSSILKWNHIS